MPQLSVFITWGVFLIFVFSILLLSRQSTRHLLDLTTPWRQHIAAENRARLLLRDVLTPTEYQQIAKFGYLEVQSPNYPQRIYRIPGAGGLVKVFDRGCAVMELCLQPVDPLPDGDVVIIHKLMIEANEEEYLQRANHFAPGIISLRYYPF